MSDQQSPYPFDGTGTKTSNIITREHHSLTNANSDAYHSIIVKFPPFFEVDLIVEKKIGDEYFILNRDVHYNVGFRAEDVSQVLRKPVSAQVAMSPIGPNDGIFITYMTVGGGNIIDYDDMTAKVAAFLKLPRMTVWDNVVKELNIWQPTSHDLDANDVAGYGDLISSLNRVEESISGRDPSSLLTHMLNSEAHGLGQAMETINSRLRDIEAKIIELERLT